MSAIWFDCRVDQKRDVDVCRAWNDKGRLVAAGDFRLRGQGHAATAAELQPSTLGDRDDTGHSDVIWLFGPDKLISAENWSA